MNELIFCCAIIFDFSETKSFVSTLFAALSNGTYRKRKVQEDDATIDAEDYDPAETMVTETIGPADDDDEVSLPS